MSAEIDLWSPEAYSAFGWERLRPAIDLLNRVDLSAPNVVYDLGCGTGGITRRLAARWPGAKVFGVDKSPAMLAEAQREQSTITWIEEDITRWLPERPADLVFSNAALQWIDNHASVLPQLIEWLRPGGVLAIQMPRNYGEPSHTAIAETVDAGPWRERLRPAFRSQPVAAAATYAEMLLPLTSSLDVWESVYLHIFSGDDPVVAWTRGTTLHPLMRLLDSAEQLAFLADYSQRIAKAYPRRADGLTLFPFRRLFIAATR